METVMRRNINKKTIQFTESIEHN